MNLFREVRDFIRNNDVGEEDVAKYFGIPKGQVRQWLREGRIQYKDHEGKISSLTCTICGKKIDYGNTCDECRRYEKLQVVAKAHAMESSRMRYLDKDKIKGN
jgi:RecJ-like exonuclease